MALHQRYNYCALHFFEQNSITSLRLIFQDCADRMLKGIPLRQLWYYVDWTIFAVAHLYSLAPEFFDWFVRIYLPTISNLFI